MEKNQRIDLTKIEMLVETDHALLVGGFSMSIQHSGTSYVEPTNTGCTSNNCNGGNCVAGCTTNKILCL